MKLYTLSEKLELTEHLKDIFREAWPEFLLHWECEDWHHVFTTFAEYQVLILDDNGELMAFGLTIPLFFSKSVADIPDDLKVIVETAVEQRHGESKPNILVALAAVVSKDHKNKGLSYELVKAMKENAKRNDIDTLVVPVRPTLKKQYPLIPIENYARWKRDDGLPYDPWLRVHARLGGKVLKSAEVSMIITGTVKEWEEWVGIRIFETGKYIVDGALSPVEIDYENDVGTYVDPCIWVEYSL